MPERGGAGPCWVRAASGTAGSSWTRAVTTGTTKPQLRRHSQPRPELLQRGGGGFEPLSQPLLWIALGPQRVGDLWSLADAQVRALVGRLPQVNGLPSSALRQRFKVVPKLAGVLAYEAQTTYEGNR